VKFGIILSNREVLTGSATTRDLLALADAVEASPRLESVWVGDSLLVNQRLGALPLLAFHLAFGQPLLGMPREGLAERLGREYPDAYRLLFTLHPAIDLSVIPLAAIFYAVLWRLAPERSAPARYGVAVSLIATSLAVALSLAIHSTLVHIRF